MSANGKVIANFPIYGQFGAIHKPDLDALSVKLTSSLKVTFHLTETKKRTNKSLKQLSHYCFE